MFEKIKAWYRQWKEKREERLWPERQIVVEIGDELISAKYPDGDFVTAKLDSLEKIFVDTNDSGPWGADVWYVIVSSEGACHYPQGATGDKEALDFLLGLDGFNEQEFIKAMGSTSNARFLCWEK